MPESGLSEAHLTIVQGFAWLKEENQLSENLKSVIRSTSVDLKKATEELDSIRLVNDFNSQSISEELDSIRQIKDFNGQSINELQVLFPTLKNAAITRTYSLAIPLRIVLILLAVLSFNKPVSKLDKQRITDWLKVKYKEENVKIVVRIISVFELIQANI